MKTIETEMMVTPDHTAIIHLKLPHDVSTGRHRARIVVDPDGPPTAPGAAVRTLFSPEGLWAGRGTDISDEELATARAEMWGKLDREEYL